MDMSCSPSQPSEREPFALPIPIPARQEAAVIFFAHQEDPTLGHEIDRTVRNTPSDDVEMPTKRILGPMGTMGIPTDDDCNDLRDPAAFRVDGGGDWLLYTCRRNGALPEIHALPLISLDWSVDASVMPISLLLPQTLGEFASAGVWGPEPVMDYSGEGDPLLRLWFMARSIGGATTVGLAQASFKDTSTGSLPHLSPFDANPVLGARSAGLGACGTTCAVSNVAVSRSDAATLRFLVARRQDDVYTLVPLEQPWAHGVSR